MNSPRKNVLIYGCQKELGGFCWNKIIITYEVFVDYNYIIHKSKFAFAFSNLSKF